MKKKILAILLVVLTGFFVGTAVADDIDPASYTGTLAVGESITITKTVTIDDAPSSGILDVMFLIDTSGSMEDEIDAAKAAASSVLSGLAGFGDLAAGVGYYDEPGPGPGYPDAIVSDLSTSADSTIFSGITLSMGGGGADFPEEGIRSTTELALGATWRPGSTRFIIALGDATFKESDGFTEAGALAALDDKGITFIGIDCGRMTLAGVYPAYSYGDTIETNPQTLADATGGSILSSSGLDIDNLVTDIIAGVTASYSEYSTVTLDDLGAGMPGVGVSVVATGDGAVGDSYVGDFDLSDASEFMFDVTFTGLEEGVYDFATLALVDGGAVASEADHFTVVGDGEVPVPEPSTIILLGAGLVGLVTIRRKKK